MESSCSWEQKTLIGELIQGMELAKQLRQNLGAKSSAETREFLVQRILSSYEKSLLILKWSGSMGGQQQQPPPQGLGVATNLPGPESPKSVNESPRSDIDQDFIRDGSKKRKALPRWTDQVRVNSENRLEGPQDDGYSWRKYGQKDILGAKYPRSYYRCTFRNTQGCWATKQVQRSDEDPYLFEITYRGTHTCSQANNSVQPPTSPQNQDQKPNNNHVSNYIPQHQQFEHCSPKFPSNLSVVTEDLEGRELVTNPFTFPSSHYGCFKGDDDFSPLLLENETFFGSFSRSFISPATPESGCYPLSPFQMNRSVGFQNVHRTESDLTDIISANTSASNSPIPDLDFSLDPVDIDPNFPFDTPGFFS